MSRSEEAIRALFNLGNVGTVTVSVGPFMDDVRMITAACKREGHETVEVTAGVNDINPVGPERLAEALCALHEKITGKRAVPE